MEEKPLVKDKVTEELRDQIQRLQTDAFVRIPSERELSETLGVSRISVRAAIKSLVREGWLVQEQGRGTFIKPKAGLRMLHIVCSPDLKQHDPFYNEFLVQLTNAAAMRSIHLFIVRPEQLPERPPNCPLVAVGQLDASLLAELAGKYERVATLLGDPAGTPGVAQLAFDDERIGRDAADALIERGHRSLALLAGPDKFRSAQLRTRGFVGRARERSVAVVVRRAKMNWQGGYESGDDIASLLRGPAAPSSPPTALFAANDWMAAGLIQKLKERGFRLPDDLSVVGCDDIPLSAQFEPAIATFRLDVRALIAETLAVLERPPAPADEPAPAIRLRADFIERASLRSNLFEGRLNQA